MAQTDETAVQPISTARITAVVYVLSVLMVVGKYLPAITAFFAALNLVLVRPRRDLPRLARRQASNTPRHISRGEWIGKKERG